MSYKSGSVGRLQFTILLSFALALLYLFCAIWYVYQGPGRSKAVSYVFLIATVLVGIVLPVSYLLIQRNLSKRQQAEKKQDALKEMQEKYRKAQAIGRMGHWELNMKSHRISWSDEVYRIYNITDNSIIDYDTCLSLIHPDDRSALLQALDDTIAGIAPLDLVHRIVLRDGTIRYVHALGELDTQPGRGPEDLTGTVQDVTDREVKDLEIQQMNQQLRALASSLQNIREEERAEIAREIHDDLGQQLTAITLDTSWVGRRVQGQEEMHKRIDDILSMLNDAMHSIRRISTRLRPSVLDDLGLIEALKWQIRDFQKRYGIPVELEYMENLPPLAPRTVTGLFRIFQETLTNIVRHAKATAVTASLRVEYPSGRVILHIADNGQGFEPDTVKSKKTLGLLGMKERALMMGGICEISSRPGEGTTILIAIPVDEYSISDNPTICVS
jgi:signal transduction histidine kinase